MGSPPLLEYTSHTQLMSLMQERLCMSDSGHHSRPLRSFPQCRQANKPSQLTQGREARLWKAARRWDSRIQTDSLVGGRIGKGPWLDNRDRRFPRYVHSHSPDSRQKLGNFCLPPGLLLMDLINRLKAWSGEVTQQLWSKQNCFQYDKAKIGRLQRLILRTDYVLWPHKSHACFVKDLSHSLAYCLLNLIKMFLCVCIMFYSSLDYKLLEWPISYSHLPFCACCMALNKLSTN